MPDDLDQLLRAAMKTLDEQVPSGYFEALPNQTLARLEGSSMQHGSSGTTTDARDAVAPPPIAGSDPAQKAAVKPIMDQEREEDSGLHDIRNLAQSTKQRLSSRRITSPPVSDDVLASSSGAFKNIALPQPAHMVSLPSLDQLPSKVDVAAAEKAAKEAAKKAAKEAKEAKPAQQKAQPAIAVVAPAAAPIETPVAAAVPARKAFSLPSQQRKSSKGPLLAILGLGVAAAAGGVIYMQVLKNNESAPSVAAEQTVAKQDTAAMGAPAAGSAAAAPAAAPAVVTAEPIVEATAPPVEAPKAELATDDVKQAEDKDSKRKTPPKKGGKGKVEKDDTAKPEEVKPIEKPVDVKKPVATKTEGGEGEPSFDALLKEAGVDGQKKEAKPKLDKKSLSGDDFKKAMSAPAGKAKGCYKGTQGTAMVKLTVSPSGSISKLAVTGEFAGKPEASCIESALKSASFPPWDGGPQSFTYSVLLSD
jgi:hypothetical protein